MIPIIVALPKAADAKGIRAILMKHDFTVVAACTTGAQVLSQIDDWNDGIVICGYKLADMIYSELHECLPDSVDMMVMASRNVMSECIGDDIVCLAMPLKVHDLVDVTAMMCQSVMRRRKRAKQKPKVRDEKEVALIREAKGLLMARNNMTEEEAHRYIQKCSMDSGTGMAETAQMVLTMMN